jgi:hypothetical protein
MENTAVLVIASGAVLYTFFLSFFTEYFPKDKSAEAIPDKKR